MRKEVIRLNKKKNIYKDSIEPSVLHESSNTDGQPFPLMTKPLICLIDIDEKITESIRSHGFNITSASFGQPINIPNARLRDEHLCILQYDLPRNLHEYDIFIIDMEEKKPLPYNAEDHKRTYQKDNISYYFLVEYPQTVFDSRAYTSVLFSNELKNIKERMYILIVFASRHENQHYQIVSIENNGMEKQIKNDYDNYAFLKRTHIDRNITGKEIKIAIKNAMSIT